MAERSEIYDAVCMAFRKHVDAADDQDNLKGNDSVGDFGGDSIEVIEISCDLQHKFGITINDDELFPDPALRAKEQLGKFTVDRFTEVIFAKLNATSTSGQ